MSWLCRAQVEELAQRARIAGMSAALAQALRGIRERLESDARAWGDPQFRCRDLGLVACQAMHGSLRVRYAVHQIDRIAFVQELKPIFDHPLADDD